MAYEHYTVVGSGHTKILKVSMPASNDDFIG